ncbi:hypothetical protein HT585_13005 [Ensifer sp. HO-A22]|uniref:Uncharacterized protein n=1 Tax=Ensifer oleiphilus TaxID=2742698 RepID=A0A7Y6UMU6_9HYPH|nr:hypothetical protein [Ensifer oleiphilus]
MMMKISQWSGRPDPKREGEPQHFKLDLHHTLLLREIDESRHHYAGTQRLTDGQGHQSEMPKQQGRSPEQQSAAQSLGKTDLYRRYA